MRLESSADAFLVKSKEMALLCGSVCHILFLIKVIQNEVRTNIKHNCCRHKDSPVREHYERTLGFHSNCFVPVGRRAGASRVCGNVYSGFENDLH